MKMKLKKKIKYGDEMETMMKMMKMMKMKTMMKNGNNDEKNFFLRISGD